MIHGKIKPESFPWKNTIKTVDGGNRAPVERKVACPIIYNVLYIPAGDRRVLNHQQHHHSQEQRPKSMGLQLAADALPQCNN